jgi:uncharacterized protein (TIGR00730 family)
MEKSKPAICVFCGSSFGSDPRFAEAAHALGRLIAERGFSLIFGGGGLGLMGVTATAAHEAGAPVTGVLPEFLRHIEQPPEWEDDIVVIPSLQQRKARMLALADAFVVLPGGLGTMDELFEVLTALQLKRIAKPLVLVDVAGFFAPVKILLGHLVERGFANSDIAELYALAATPKDALDIIASRLHRAPGG